MDHPVKIKICGITNYEDAQRSASLGADFLGLIFCESSRRVSFLQAQEIIENVTVSVNWVGVFRNESIDKVREFASKLHLPWIQLHGDEDVHYIDALRKEFSVLKTFEIDDPEIQNTIEHYPHEWVLLDTPKQSDYPMDLFFAEQIARKKKVFLAGGLKLENITEAIRTVRPYAIDVLRGVEAYPGKKDPTKLEIIIRRVKQNNHHE